MSEAHALHPLKSLLQLQLASDSYAAIHLPYILQSLTTDAFLPSPHLSKWTARLSSLLSCKDAGGRWAGLSIALRTSILSGSTMVECAQGWISVALPVLSRPEHPPILKASIRLLEYIFTSTVDMPEFQRQLATPNIPKFSQALATLADTSKDEELRNLSFATLTRLVPIYPTLHRALYPTLSSLSMKFLNGTPDKPTNATLMDGASKLYSVLPFTGGKVGSAALWRKAVDETLSFCWDAFGSITTTIVWDGPKINKQVTTDMDPISALPLGLDRLRCGIKVLEQLLHSPVARPVRIPIGSITDLIITMLSCTNKDVIDSHIDSTIRSIEISMIPEIWHLCANLLCSLTGCVTAHLTPHVPRIITYIVHHLEQKIPPTDRLVFLRALDALLSNNLPIHSTLLANRVAKVALGSVSVLSLPSPTSGPSQMDQHASKQGKKRTRGYEGDEVFSNAKTRLCSTQVDGEIILVALDVLEAIMQQAQLSSSVYSIASRTVLSHLLMLPHIPPIKISENIALHGLIVQKLHHACIANGTGNPDGISKIFGLAIAPRTRRLENASFVDLAIHPRLPPLLRSMPHVESLALYKSEEGDEESSIRKNLGLAPIIQKDTVQSNNNNEDVAMKDTRTQPTISNGPPPIPPVLIKEPAVSTTPASNTPQADLPKTVPPPGLAHQQLSANDLPTAPEPLKTSIDTLDKALPQPNLASSTTNQTPVPSLEPQSSISHVTSSVPEQPAPVFSMTIDEDEDDNEDVPIINPDSDSEDED